MNIINKPLSKIKVPLSIGIVVIISLVSYFLLFGWSSEKGFSGGNEKLSFRATIIKKGIRPAQIKYLIFSETKFEVSKETMNSIHIVCASGSKYKLSVPNKQQYWISKDGKLKECSFSIKPKELETLQGYGDIQDFIEKKKNKSL